MRHTTILLSLMALLLTCVTSGLAAEQKNYLPPTFKGMTGRMVFLIPTSNYKTALRTITTAVDLQKEGIPTTLIFEKDGVILATRHTDPSFYDEHLDSDYIMSDTATALADLLKNNYSILIEEDVEEPTPQQLSVAEAAFRTFHTLLQMHLDFGGEAYVCPQCFQLYNGDADDLVHPKISLDKQQLHEALQGIKPGQLNK